MDPLDGAPTIGKAYTGPRRNTTHAMSLPTTSLPHRRTTTCRFSGLRIYPGRGILFIRVDGQVRRRSSLSGTWSWVGMVQQGRHHGCLDSR